MERLLEVDATLINGCNRSSETPSKQVKNPERINKIRKILKLPWNIPDELLIYALKKFDSEHGTTDIISLLISKQEDDSDDEYDYTDPESYYLDLDESSHEQYYDSDEESDYDSDLNVETHINPDIALSEDDSDLENYQWGIWMHEMGKVNVEIRSYAKGTGNIIGILKNNVETDINSSDSSANCQNSSDSSSKGSSSGYTIREYSENDIDLSSNCSGVYGMVPSGCGNNQVTTPEVPLETSPAYTSFNSSSKGSKSVGRYPSVEWLVCKRLTCELA